MNDLNKGNAVSEHASQRFRFLPRLSWRFYPVWQRNFLVWRKLALASIVGNIAEPAITLVAFGFGLGSSLKTMDGIPYLFFLASGSVASSIMMAASFEATYSAFSRMHMQKTWDALLNAPLSLDDIVLAELLWAATKAGVSGLAILLVLFVLGVGLTPWTLLCVPVIFLTGLAFSAIGLIINALARSYDVFTHYITLALMPMIFLSGVYYPVSSLPAWLQQIVYWLPLNAAVRTTRSLLLGSLPGSFAVDIALLVLYTVLAFICAINLTRRRLLS